MSYTPAPWTITDGQSSRVYLVNRGSDAVGEVVFCDTRNPADARLIAAAPDLLAALQLIEIDKDGDGFVCADAIPIIRAAIEKATI